ncbi:MAG TPA: circadian clock protein KaiC [Burkholderiales bacterium]|nr:circadian clock protein KaiC [Burkholderiales bacterium]
MPATTATPSLRKTPSGIRGLDEITGGGLPAGRPTLVCGGPGCGKTLFGIEFLVRGALDHGEPAVLMTFEERVEDLVENTRALGFDLDDLIRRKLLAIDYVKVERSEIQETGEYDLEALFVRLNYAIDSTGAKRVLLDTIESLFAGLSNETLLRSELRRLFLWLKEKGVTAVVTGERGSGSLTRNGLEEYISDCVILLDHRVTEQVSTRRLRIVKYRGSTHGTNEYPFVIDRDGITVVPITSAGLAHPAPKERVSTGIAHLDAMLPGGGYYRGSTVLITGSAGTGKTSLAARFAEAACERGERALYFAFEESRDQLTRNMASLGLDLERHAKSGKLVFSCSRPTLVGLEAHLSGMMRQVDAVKPAVVVVDPISSLLTGSETVAVQAMLIRLVDHMKTQQITLLMTSLVDAHAALPGTETSISSIVDGWIALRDVETEGERKRMLYVLKVRGVGHSRHARELDFGDGGIRLLDTARAGVSAPPRRAGSKRARK